MELVRKHLWYVKTEKGDMYYVIKHGVMGHWDIMQRTTGETKEFFGTRTFDGKESFLPDDFEKHPKRARGHHIILKNKKARLTSADHASIRSAAPGFFPKGVSLTNSSIRSVSEMYKCSEAYFLDAGKGYTLLKNGNSWILLDYTGDKREFSGISKDTGTNAWRGAWRKREDIKSPKKDIQPGQVIFHGEGNNSSQPIKSVRELKLA